MKFGLKGQMYSVVSACSSGAHAIGFYAGSNLAATLQTAEQGDSARRMRLQGLRPVTDAASALGAGATDAT